MKEHSHKEQPTWRQVLDFHRLRDARSNREKTLALEFSKAAEGEALIFESRQIKGVRKKGGILPIKAG